MREARRQIAHGAAAAVLALDVDAADADDRRRLESARDALANELRRRARVPVTPDPDPGQYALLTIEEM